MAEANKSKLLHVLEKRISQSSPASVDAYVIDGNFLLHALPPNLPKNFGGIARVMLVKMVSNCKKRINVVFDTYRQPSIKEAERIRRGTEKRDFVITGPEQLRPTNFQEGLKSQSLKSRLPKFLAQEWAKSHYAPIGVR